MKKYTYSAQKEDNQGKWWVIDADGMVLGRLATLIASRIRGKHNPLYTPHTDTGDWIVVVNAEKIRLTGRKWEQKTYYRHTGYTGGIKAITAEKLREKRPEDMVRFAVRGMLPKNSLGRKLRNKLHVYAGPTHPHMAQQPEELKLQ